jgi:hypothetical protein
LRQGLLAQLRCSTCARRQRSQLEYLLAAHDSDVTPFLIGTWAYLRIHSAVSSWDVEGRDTFSLRRAGGYCDSGQFPVNSLRLAALRSMIHSVFLLPQGLGIWC